MVSASSLCIRASQQEFTCANCAEPRLLAETLLAAIHAPVKLEWEAEVAHPSTGIKAKVIASVSLDTEVTSWPPRKLNLKVIPDDVESRQSNLLSDAGFEVSSSVSAAQLAQLLHASCTSANCSELATNQSGYVSTEVAMSEDSSQPVSSSTSSADLPLTASDPSRGLLQPTCLHQWHANTCAHHALFNVQCMLDGALPSLRNYQLFWSRTFRNIQQLAVEGERSGRWPPSRVIKGVADKAHLQCLIESSDTLRGRVTALETPEEFAAKIQDSSSPMSVAIDDILSGRSRAHGFLLGATNHWYAAVATSEPCCSGFLDDTGGRNTLSPVGFPLQDEQGGRNTRLYFFDSYNEPLVTMQSNEELAEMAEKCLDGYRQMCFAELRAKPAWEHRPQQDFDLAFEEGLPEWWKGKRKPNMFWHQPPLETQRQLKKQEFENVRYYLNSLSSALKLSPQDISKY